MPTNLPAEARAKWLKVMEAKSPEEKLRALEEFLSSVPKHKGTEKLVKQIKKQMAQLRKEIERKRAQRRGKGRSLFIKKSGDAQIAILGLVNEIKLSIMQSLTNARINMNSYVQSKPLVGTFNYEGVHFQLIDIPPFYPGFSETTFGTQLVALVRNVDAVILALSKNLDLKYQVEIIERELEKSNILIRKPKTIVEIQRKGEGGITVIGTLKNCTISDVQKLLHSYKIYHAYVKIYGEATLDDIEEALFRAVIYKPAVIVVEKGASLKLNQKKNCINVPILIFDPSSVDSFVKYLGSTLMKVLDLIKVYTREPSGKVAEKPLVIKRGTTVGEVAKMIHSYLYENFKYAKIWSRHSKISYQKVGKDYVLHDGDIIQIVT